MKWRLVITQEFNSSGLYKMSWMKVNMDLIQMKNTTVHNTFKIALDHRKSVWYFHEAPELDSIKRYCPTSKGNPVMEIRYFLRLSYFFQDGISYTGKITFYIEMGSCLFDKCVTDRHVLLYTRTISNLTHYIKIYKYFIKMCLCKSNSSGITLWI